MILSIMTLYIIVKITNVAILSLKKIVIMLIVVVLIVLAAFKFYKLNYKNQKFLFSFSIFFET
jgi:hypothetical protein